MEQSSQTAPLDGGADARYSVRRGGGGQKSRRWRRVSTAATMPTNHAESHVERDQVQAPSAPAGASKMSMASAATNMAIATGIGPMKV